MSEVFFLSALQISTATYGASIASSADRTKWNLFRLRLRPTRRLLSRFTKSAPFRGHPGILAAPQCPQAADRPYTGPIRLLCGPKARGSKFMVFGPFFMFPSGGHAAVWWLCARYHVPKAEQAGPCSPIAPSDPAACLPQNFGPCRP